jgi:hypothetical protein
MFTSVLSNIFFSKSPYEMATSCRLHTIISKFSEVFLHIVCFNGDRQISTIHFILRELLVKKLFREFSGMFSLTEILRSER